MQIELEKIIHSLKGVASILSIMSEIPKGNLLWQEWAFQLLLDILSRCIKSLEEMAQINNRL